jgi:hypothetical protein
MRLPNQAVQSRVLESHDQFKVSEEMDCRRDRPWLIFLDSFRSVYTPRELTALGTQR